MKLYISGPMTGYAELNYPAFTQAAQLLRDAGYDVVSPHELNPQDAESWVECMKVDIRALLDCGGVATLVGHEKSKGAILENTIAAAMGLEIKSLADWLEK